MSYAEIHFHLLPGIDDGPSSIEESVALAAAAAAEGTRTIVATPHVHPQFVTGPATLAARVHEVQARLSAERIPIEVRCGGELDLAMPERLSDAELDTIAHGPRGRRWVLLEAPLRGLEDDYTVVADELRERGFAVVVAHPERSFTHPDAAWRAVEHELAAGSALQINAWSVAGLYGERVRATAMALLRRAPHVAVASDAHGEARMPALRLALDALTRVGVSDAVRLVSSVPHDLLEHGLAVAPDALAA
ncbi:MAG TPA: CpsB/CapC family capsule biosynthesis tyrosine phosphatase [Solirubrobacteraceae bacterium]|nr:CpsB/CapC family capsule biosynthesis tyrosine phosphatase [Solirubrobacteraceae bacterium]